MLQCYLSIYNICVQQEEDKFESFFQRKGGIEIF
jgi:hypothetical protein